MKACFGGIRDYHMRRALCALLVLSLMPIAGCSRNVTYQSSRASSATSVQSGDDALVVSGDEQGVIGSNLIATDTDSNVVRVSNSGVLAAESILAGKKGEGSDDAAGERYAVNSTALMLGMDTRGFLSDSYLFSDDPGAPGLFVADGATVYALEDTVVTRGDESAGIVSAYNGTLIADGLSVYTDGADSPAVIIAADGGSASMTSSTLESAGGSTLLDIADYLELDNVDGRASGASLVKLGSGGVLRVNDSMLAQADSTDPLLSISDSGSTPSGSDTATLMLASTRLAPSTGASSLIEVDGVDCSIMLDSCAILPESQTALPLVHIMGGPTSPTVDVTMAGESLEGDIVLSAPATLSVTLDSEASWQGVLTDAAGIGTAGVGDASSTASTGVADAEDAASASDDAGDEVDARDEDILAATTVSIDIASDATWVVTADTSVTDLTMAYGARVVDANGDTVSIYTGDGLAVEGAGPRSITVTGTFADAASSDATTASNGIPASNGAASSGAPSASDDDATSSGAETTAESVDRSGFDGYYGTSTTFGSNSRVTRPARVDPDTVSSMFATFMDSRIAADERTDEGWTTSGPFAYFFSELRAFFGF